MFDVEDTGEGLDDLLSHIEINGSSNGNKYRKLHNRKNEEFATKGQFNDHNDAIRKQIIEEYTSKRRLRNISYFVIVGFSFLLLVFISLFMLLKSDEAHLSLLITLTVAVFGNLATLFAIIFRYVFSSTTELTDYAKILLEHEE